MDNDPIHIDGSQGEGGGQIVRSSLALSMITGREVIIERVRAGRAKPGLMRQHLTAVRAAQMICQATAEGDSIGSSKLRFRPGRVQGGDYHFAVGTAGSTTLVLQTILPPILLADRPSRLVLEGGTHNPWAPPFDFIQKSFLPLVNRMGPKVTATLEQVGFYPAGGGRFVVEVQPAARLTGFDLLERGELRASRARVLISNLPNHIAEREQNELRRLASWNDDAVQIEPVNAVGPGNVVIIEYESEHVTEVFSGFGEHGVKAETVARHAIDDMRAYLASQVPVGPYLADQLLLQLGLSTNSSTGDPNQASSSFRTVPLTEHSRTHINVLQTFLPIRISADRETSSDSALVSVQRSDE